MSEYSVYAATVRQFAGVRAERDALAAALAAKTEQVAGLLEERDDLRAWIIEASSAFRFDGGTDTLEEALGLVRMCHEGAAALTENAELRAKLTAARDTADKLRRAYIGEIPGEITTTLVCDTCKREFAGTFNSQAWYVCHICGGDLWHKKQSPDGETLDGGSNAKPE